MSQITIEFQFRSQRFKNAADGLRLFADSVTGSFARLPETFKKELKDYLDTVAEALAKRHGNPWPSGTTSSSLSTRSGNLIATIRNSVRVYGSTLNDIGGSISAPFYARIHETGGTISAKNVKYLTIPLPAALNANGTPIKRSARDWENTFILKSKRGNLLIMQRNGKDLIPLYVLKTEVQIPARLHMADTINSGKGYFVDKAMAAMLLEVQKGIAP